MGEIKVLFIMPLDDYSIFSLVRHRMGSIWSLPKLIKRVNINSCCPNTLINPGKRIHIGVMLVYFFGSVLLVLPLGVEL